ncbi:MAG TPA: hypothetical protein VHD15_17705 [Hyphomicrobiales bacterium]|nr:hypothetical protein [Hyphomicrobiales bacterium]
MSRSPIPDLTSRRALVAAALTVAAFAGAMQMALSWKLVQHGMVDTDDAMRLFMVHGLLDGAGWFNVHVDRVAPPLGLDMHWSRFVDGGIAVLVLAFRTVLPRAAAEVAATSLWPVLWAFPAALGTLLAARRLGGTAATFACLVFMLIYQLAFFAFRPGRIDHDNVQIAFTAIAFAGTLAIDRARWAGLAAGIGTGLALNIGLEALPLLALFGAGIGVRLALDPRLAPAARQYAVALALATAVPYVAQTAPTLLPRAVCDQIGANLVAGLLVASAGLLALAALAPRLPGPEVRLAGLAVVGAAALAVYLAIHPSCVRGPFADVDPRLFSIWLDHVTEMQSLPAMLHTDPRAAVGLVTGPFAAVATLGLALTRPWVRRDPAWIVAAVALVVAVLAMAYALRSGTYAMWFGMPVMAAAIVRIGLFGEPPALIRATATACLASPLVVTALAVRLVAGLAAPPPPAHGIGGTSTCTAAPAFAGLDAAAPGLVGGDIDLGPFILLYTGDSVLGAPYHRDSTGIREAHALMAATPDRARTLAGEWGLAYLAHCAPAGPAGTPKDASLAAALDAGTTPPWLTPLSDEGHLQVYRVAPPLRGDQP